MEQRIQEFYRRFKKTSLYYLPVFLIIFSGILFFPMGRFMMNTFSTGPFIVGPYIHLFLMFIVFTLYRNIFLYLYVIILFILSSILSFIGIGMGSVTEKDVGILSFFLPIFTFLIINIIVAIYTNKYKRIDR